MFHFSLLLDITDSFTLCFIFQKRKTHNAFTVIEQILSWADVEILALLNKKNVTKKGRRLLTQTDMTLCTDETMGEATGSVTNYDVTTFGMTTLGITMNETLSDTLLGQKRSVGPGRLGSLRCFAVDLIQVIQYTVVCVCVCVCVREQLVTLYVI